MTPQCLFLIVLTNDAVVFAARVIHPEGVVTVSIQSLTHSKPSTVSCTTFLLNSESASLLTVWSLASFHLRVRPTLHYSNSRVSVSSLFIFSPRPSLTSCLTRRALFMKPISEICDCKHRSPSLPAWSQMSADQNTDDLLRVTWCTLPSPGHAHNTSGNDC